MSKGLKSLYTLLGLISLTLLGFVAVISKQHIYLPSFNWLDWDFNLPSPIDVGMYHYFFWGSISAVCNRFTGYIGSSVLSKTIHRV